VAAQPSQSPAAQWFERKKEPVNQPQAKRKGVQRDEPPASNWGFGFGGAMQEE